MLKTTGRAAVVVPDNVLFEGGAGETVRKKLLENTDLHTILRLPTGIFYAPRREGERHLLRQPRGQPEPVDEGGLVLRLPHQHPSHAEEEARCASRTLPDFIKCYNPQNRHKRKATWDEEKNPEGRWRKFTYDELIARDKTSLDVFWLKDKSLTDLDNLPEPDELAEEIIENLEAGLDSFRQVLAGLSKAG